MAVQVYRSGSIIRVDGLDTGNVFLIPGQTGLKLSNEGKFRLIDNIKDVGYDLGVYTDLRDRNNVSFVSEDAAITYLANLINTPRAIDITTGASVGIDYAHSEIHSGNHYKAGKQNISLNQDDTIELLFVAPDTTTWAHWVLVAQTTGQCVIQVYEGTTTSDNGTSITPINRNRNSSNVATVAVYYAPTVTDDGTKIAERWLGGFGFKEASSSEYRGNKEFILKRNTKYLVRLTAINDSIKGVIGGDWYEHTNIL